MNALIDLTAEQTMTLKEISELLKSRPDNLLKSAERLASQGVIKLNCNEGGKINQRLNKIDSITLVAQNKPELTKAIVIRWQELESAQPQLPNFNDPAAAARAWADEHETLQLEQEKTAKLTTALDQEFGYCSILRAAAFLRISEKTFSWRPLKAESLRIGYPAKKAPSPRYGYQNLYPLQAFRTCYPEHDFTGLTPDSNNLTPLTF